MQLIESQYLASVYSCKILYNSSHIGIPLYVPFRKMSFQNRCVIPTANGLVNLTVPLVGGREVRQVMGEVRIDHSQAWQVRHWRTITSAYNRSPFFEYYAEGLEKIYQTRPEFLHEWNKRLMDWLVANLKIRTFVENLAQPGEGRMERMPLPKDFLDPFFTQELPHYQQVFMDRLGFVPNVSCIDLLCCLGPSAGAVLSTDDTPNGF